MHAVFINQCHPEMPHVCGLRLRKFAEVLTMSGHRVVLLVEAYPEDLKVPKVEELESNLLDHNWDRPFILPCRAQGFEKSRWAREGKGSAISRTATILKSYVLDGGMFPDWQSGAEIYFDTLSRVFSPDVIWATFGNTDSWILAQKLSRLSDCPWVADFKDNWGAFLPHGLKVLMAQRFRDAAHMTVLSETQLHDANRWFPGQKTVLYSGVEPASSVSIPSGFRILLTGSIYSTEHLAELVIGLKNWLESSQISGVEFCYAGNEGPLVERISELLKDFCHRQFLGFIPPESLAKIQSSVALNMYVYRGGGFFHHKSLELIAAGPPILSYPGESLETRRLASSAGCKLFACESQDQIVDAMNNVTSEKNSHNQRNFPLEFTWKSRAKALEDLLCCVRRSLK